MPSTKIGYFNADIHQESSIAKLSIQRKVSGALLMSWPEQPIAELGKLGEAFGWI
jgi:hypothetical protein